MDKGFTWVQFMWRIAFFSTLALLSNYMLYFTLRILSATVVLCIFATTVSINYLLSWVVLHQQFVGIRVREKSFATGLHDSISYVSFSRLWPSSSPTLALQCSPTWTAYSTGHWPQ